MGSLVEIAVVGVLTQLRRHGRDVEAEEATADNSDGSNNVDIPDDHDGGASIIRRVELAV